MPETLKIIGYIAVMAVVTYLIRAVPFVVFRKKIQHRFIRSFLYYIPYAVLSAMTLPAILYSTGNIISACVGLAVALVLSFLERGLLTVAISACTAVYITELVQSIIK